MAGTARSGSNLINNMKLRLTFILQIAFLLFGSSIIFAEEQVGDLEKFCTAIKTLKIGEDTMDDVKNKLPESRYITWSNHLGTFLTYQFFCGEGRGRCQIVSNINFSDQSLKLKYLNVSKNEIGRGASGGMVKIFEKGSLTESTNPSVKDEKFVVTVSTDGPSTPDLGQIYLNTTDSHFYGWNGKEWKQLDK
jgi:hypothetical protein